MFVCVFSYVLLVSSSSWSNMCNARMCGTEHHGNAVHLYTAPKYTCIFFIGLSWCQENLTSNTILQTYIQYVKIILFWNTLNLIEDICYIWMVDIRWIVLQRLINSCYYCSYHHNSTFKSGYVVNVNATLLITENGQ